MSSIHPLNSTPTFPPLNQTKNQQRHRSCASPYLTSPPYLPNPNKNPPTQSPFTTLTPLPPTIPIIISNRPPQSPFTHPPQKNTGPAEVPPRGQAPDRPHAGGEGDHGPRRAPLRHVRIRLCVYICLYMCICMCKLHMCLLCFMCVCMYILHVFVSVLVDRTWARGEGDQHGPLLRTPPSCTYVCVRV